MRNIILALFVLVLMGCNCIAQIPTQYAYVDENCEAVLGDYLPMVIVSDNCGIASVVQVPEAGFTISGTIPVEIQATDIEGNITTVQFDVVVIDTIPPSIILNPDFAYSDEEVSDMYWTFYTWAQLKQTEFREKFPQFGFYEINGDTIYYQDIYEAVVDQPYTLTFELN